MNVQAIPSLSDRVNQIRMMTAKIVNNEILPNGNQLWATRRDGQVDDEERSQARTLRHEIQAKVKQAGLWAPHLPKEYGGCGLSFLEHAYMNEILAYSMGAASLFGVVAPNSGNQKILLKYGTEEQKKKWLVPLTEGKLESGFSMTEPDSAGSDPRSIKTTATRDGNDWVINGHKWFTSNAKRADFLIVMCRTADPE
ncbi:MAG: acyl-CoA dehydrogenase family protein, partial [Gemmatimonadetes bacterium]|nr:acyl-CoA dehydrogenase family protein [Gemmatimonadota bacterium]